MPGFRAHENFGLPQKVPKPQIAQASGRVPIFRKLLIFLFVFVCAGPAFGQISIPNTPAGHALAMWLEAFNSGDRAKIEAYVNTYDPKNSVDFMTSFRSQTGGFDLLSIENSQPLLIKFQVREKASPTIAIGSIQLKSADPLTVDTFSLRAIPPGAIVEDFKLTPAIRQHVIDGIAASLREFYVYPETAQKMDEAIKAHQKSGDYDAIADGDAFVALLTSQLQDVSHDKHLRVNYSPYKLPAEQQDPSPGEESKHRKEMERDNCGFRKVEILPDNIGYLKFNMFANPEVCGPTVVAAMNFLAHVDAIIFDLRENGGGDPKMVAFIATYLFDQPMHLSDIYNRKENTTTQFWTLPYVPGTRLANTPAFVLTSKSTFSGAEDFIYNLKILKRVSIVGETTGGGAHPVSGHTIGYHFMIGVPFARSINPITRSNWEGTGVEPDVPVPASEALETAEKLAAAKIQAIKNQPK